MAENWITVVSGWPRSGTSMMMRMLEAGGLAPVTDGIRSADADNPNGYYEFEAVKDLGTSGDWLQEARGRAVKVVLTRLRDLLKWPFSYRIILMRRAMSEMIVSQNKLLAHRGGPEGWNLSEAERAREYQQFDERLMTDLDSEPRAQVLRVQYADVVADAARQAQCVNVFLGGMLNEAAMAASVNPQLYRNRQGATDKVRENP